MWFIYFLVFALMFLGLLAVGELIVVNSPEKRFSKWWRKNVIYECQECD